MHALKLTPIGDGLGVILPKEIVDRLHLKSGDTLFLSESPYGLWLTAHDLAIDGQMVAAQEIMRERRDVLRELAK